VPRDRNARRRAIEYDSLRELWAICWSPGQCAIGSVKSTVGPLLTGAGAAALAKVLLAMKAEQLPPQANSPSPRVDCGTRTGRSGAACSGAVAAEGRARTAARRGQRVRLGGVNAHLLVEEWTGIPEVGRRRIESGKSSPKRSRPNRHAGRPPERLRPANRSRDRVGRARRPWRTRADSGAPAGGDVAEPARRRRMDGRWPASPCPPGFYIDELNCRSDRFRIPPKELEETLPKQLLMLKVAAAALDDAGAVRDERGASSPPSPRAVRITPRPARSSASVLDLNTTNFHLRWSVLASGGVSPLMRRKIRGLTPPARRTTRSAADREPHDGRAGQHRREPHRAGVPLRRTEPHGLQ